ncbi:protein FAR1-RELATED SEQUENCE 6 isoform X1 [Beta vulgaris subsp. vulgaris]|uniref:protein FAR1-RELATED SEQUENCE 6 isoform X1 n=2 Tax=Beta vulgaris subsp. vulgaris TaxID=3555 RepID=UPI00254997A8|nr:protein FAR1-RELATED SEQUENCE 6 isoform X1 [Beta vulgaris subsp. vulgaris]
MGGKSPMGILTDQDAAMRKALLTSMPEARHRWCLWHITEKFCSKLGMFEKYQDIKDDLLYAIYDSLDPSEFEENWNNVIAKYDLVDNGWLGGLYREREMWVPAYMRHMFWAGMKTTQRVESINSFFDGYVNKHTRLYEFAERYCEAMEVRANDEKENDANSARYVRTLETDFSVEAIYQKIYTDNKLKEVQRECTRSLYLNVQGKNVVSDNVLEHYVQDRVWVRCKDTRKEIVSKKKRMYKVTFDSSTKDVSCACKLFECNGIMCRHMIYVYEIHDQLEVPKKYILRRWRKDVHRKHTRVKVAYHDPSKTDEVRRYDYIFDKFVPICEKASKYEENIAVIVEMFDLMNLRVEETSAMVMRRMLEGDIDMTPNSVVKQKNNEFGPPSVGENGKKKKGKVAVDAALHNVKDPPCKKVAHRTRGMRYVSVAEEAKRKIASKSKASKSRAAKRPRRKKELNLNGVGEGECSGMTATPSAGQEINMEDPDFPISVGGIQLVDGDGSIGYFTRLLGSRDGETSRSYVGSNDMLQLSIGRM